MGRAAKGSGNKQTNAYKKMKTNASGRGQAKEIEVILDATKENLPKVSVIIPVYNAEKYLNECLDSLINQTFKDIEIICVDDGSTDTSEDIIKEYAQKDSRVRVISQKNLYAGVARNTGMASARGKYYVFLDADDFFELDMLEKEYNQCEKYDADICLCGADKYDIRSNEFQKAPWLLDMSEVQEQPFNKYTVRNLYGITAANPWTKMFSARFVKEHEMQFQNLKRTNDAFFVLTSLALAEKIVVVDDVLVHYRVGQTTNLQARKEETPTLFCDALVAVKERLEKEGVYSTVQQSYLEVVVNNIQYNLSSQSTESEGYRELVACLKNKYWELFGLDEYIPGEFGVPKKYEYMMKALSQMEVLPSWYETVSPKISILIPVYNTSAYLKQCLDSITKQTLKDIEIICVNDGSTDKSLQILEKYAKRDERIKIINQENSGLFMARKVAVSECTGKFVMFLDSDDWLEETACQELYDAMCYKRADIIQFGTIVEASEGTPQSRISNLEKLLQAYPQYIYHSVLSECFEKKKFGFTIWNKIYKGSIVKKAYAHLPDDNIFKAEDLYALFAIAFYSKSYYGLTKKYYHYRFGSGLTGRQSIDLSRFLVICKQYLVATRIKDFLCNNQIFEKYEEMYNGIYQGLLNEVISNWTDYLEPDSRQEAFAAILDNWDKKEVVALLAKKYCKKTMEFAELMQGMNTISVLPMKCKVKKIGIYYPRLTIGGVQRVISLLIPVYREMGCEIVYFYDEEDNQNGFELPKEVEKICIPKFATPDIRVRELYTYLENLKVDAFIHHATSELSLIFDMLAAKVQGIPAVITIHEAFAAQISRLGIGAARKHLFYRIADLAIVLSKVQESYWKAMGVRAKFILNPMTCAFDAAYKPRTSNHSIIWVGRIADDKNCGDAIRIFAKVKNVIPDAHLIIVGESANQQVKNEIDGLVGYYKLHSSVERVGLTKDVEQYYKRASVYLMTSLVESFSMTLAESKFYGLPAVMYDIPYIDLACAEAGTITVPWNNVDKAAEEIIHLFTDRSHMKHNSKLARSCSEKLAGYDLKAAWRTAFGILENGADLNADLNADVKLSIESIYSQYSLACARHNDLQRRLDQVLKEKDKLRQELNNKNKSITWRVGRIVTYLPRKLRGGVKCYKQHGFKYTVGRIVQKIKKRLKIKRK